MAPFAVRFVLAVGIMSAGAGAATIRSHVRETASTPEIFPQVCEPPFDIGLHNDSILYSNLGGMGPDGFGQNASNFLPKSIRFGAVFQHSGHIADMIVTADTYFGTTSLNGMRGNSVEISVHPGSSTRLKVSFVNRFTDKSVKMGPFIMTLQGLTAYSRHAPQRSVKVIGSSGYTLAPDSPLIVEQDGADYTVTSAVHSACNPSQTLMHMTECQMATSISLHFLEASDFYLEITATVGDDNPIFWLGGPSNMDCPEPALCSTFTCPAFTQRRPSTADNKLYCERDVCDDSDTLTCCEHVDEAQCDSDFSLVLKDGSLAWSNLGGMGPHFGAPHSILFKNTFPIGDEMVDLEITNSTPYTPFNASANMQYGRLGMINVAAGTEVGLSMRFLKADTRERLTLTHDFIVTFFDFDMQQTGECRESVTIEDHKNYQVTDHCKVRVDEQTRRSRVTFTALEAGDQSDNPTDPTNVTDDQLDRTASVLFSSTREIKMTLAVSDGPSGRNFEFSGWSTLPCPSLASYCSTMLCPRGFLQVEDAATIRCRGANCTEYDITTCCKLDPDGVCAISSMVFDDAMVVENNLGGHGPLNGSREIRIANIFPTDSERIDMSVTVPKRMEGSYSARDSSKNGVENGFLRINVRSGTASFIQVRFFNSRGERITIPAFYMTIADVDAEREGTGVETVMMRDYEYYNVSANTSLTIDTWHRNRNDVLSGTYTSFSSTNFGVEMDNPSTIPSVLDWSKRTKAITFFYVNTSDLIMRLGVTEGRGAGRSLMISGSPSLSCPIVRQSCAAMKCPAFRRLKRNAALLECLGQTCTEEDTETCCGTTVEGECDSKHTLVLRRSNVLHDNFGGAGPGEPNTIFTDVFPHSGKVVNMIVTNTSECPLVRHTYNSVTLAPDTTCAVKFSLIEEATGMLVPDMWHYHFSFFGLGSQSDGQGKHKVVVSGVESHAVADDMPLEARAEDADGASGTYKVAFTSKNPGNQMSTTSPSEASDLDTQTSASVWMSRNEFDVQLSAPSNRKGGHTFGFAGETTLQCPPRASCTADVCPKGMILSVGMEDFPCAGAECVESDISTCCMPVECSSERFLSLNRLAWSNLHMRGPDNHQPKPTVKYLNVFPQSGDRVDLVVSATGAYFANNESKNGLNGEFGQINVASGSSVNLTLHFENRRGRRIQVPGFYFSLFDIDGVNGKESATINSYTSYSVMPRGELVVTEADEPEGEKTLSIFSTAYGNERDNPAHPLALTELHLNRSISLLMPTRTGSFSLSFTAEEGWAGRNILFGGATNLVCSTRALCSTLQCPEGSMLRADADRQVCSTRSCRSSDVPVCCEQRGQ